MRLLYRMISGPMRILDVGGTEEFWHERRAALDITLLNTFHQNGQSVIGDACDLSRFADQSFDLVFSNSVIGHVGNWDRQRQMAREIRRVGRRYFVQTPNKWFPLDWRTLVPFFHWLPAGMQAAILLRVRVGRYARVRDPETARELSTRIRNLTASEVAELFPGATIVRERVCGFTKSFIAYR